MRIQQSLRFVAAAVTILLLSDPARAQTYALKMAQTTGVPGQSVTVEILLDPAASEVSALAFYVEYDKSRLVFDSSSKGGGHLDNLEFTLPDQFSGSGIYLSDSGAVGLAVFDRTAPVTPLTQPQIIARLKFTVKEAVSGFAPVWVAPSPAASDAWGRLVTEAVLTPGGVTITEPASIPQASPGDQVASGGSADVWTNWVVGTSSVPGRWRATITLHNPDETPSRIHITRGDDGSVGENLDIGPHETRTWQASAAVAPSFLRVSSSSPTLVLEVVPALPIAREDELFDATRDAHLVGLSADPVSGSMITVVNPGSRTCEFLLTLRDAEGAIVGARTVAIDAHGARTIAVSELTPSPRAAKLVATVKSLTNGCSFLAFVSDTGVERQRPVQLRR